MSVLEASELCGVARSTISYWISKRGLPAYRKGKKFVIEPEELAKFLRICRYRLPACLEALAPPLSPAASVDISESLETGTLPKDLSTEQLLSFVHLIRKPAFIFQGLQIKSCNQKLAEQMGTKIENLVGGKITPWIHADSLEEVVAMNTARNQGPDDAPEYYELFLRRIDSVKLKAQIAISPLDMPKNTWMAIVIAVTLVEDSNPSGEPFPLVSNIVGSETKRNEP